MAVSDGLVERVSQGDDDADAAGAPLAAHQVSAAARPDAGLSIPLPKPERTSVAVTRTKVYWAWVGTPENLGRIAAAIRSSLGRALLDAQVELQSHEGIARERELHSFVPLALVRDKSGVEWRGDLEQILQEIDPNEIDYLCVRNKRGAASVLVEFSTRPAMSMRSAVEIDVYGADRIWVSGTFEQLKREVEKGVRWWGLLRRLAGLPFIWMIMLAVFVAAYSILGTRDDFIGWINTLWVASVSLAFPLALLKWVFVPFEVVGHGRKPVGRRIGAWLLGAMSLVASTLGILAALGWWPPA